MPGQFAVVAEIGSITSALGAAASGNANDCAVQIPAPAAPPTANWPRRVCPARRLPPGGVTSVLSLAGVTEPFLIFSVVTTSLPSLLVPTTPFAIFELVTALF